MSKLFYKDNQGRTIYYNLVLCACGCGELIKNRDKNGELKFKIHHGRRGKKYDGKLKAELNPMWKGDNVKYEALHLWVRSRLNKPDLCENCNIKPPIDLANITGIYNRSLNNWKYLCRRCHMISDNRMMNLKQFQVEKDCSDQAYV